MALTLSRGAGRYLSLLTIALPAELDSVFVGAYKFCLLTGNEQQALGCLCHAVQCELMK